MSLTFPPRLLITLIVTIAAVLVATAYGNITVHLALAALSALVFAVLGITDHNRLRSANATKHAIGASNARHMGLVWLWGAAILGISYALLITPWREWLHFFLGFALVGLMCVGFASTLEKDANANSDDETFLKLGRILTIGQLVGMLATLIGIAIDPDKSILSKARPDWAANIVFVFGGAALALISAYALWKQPDGRSVT